MITDGILQMRIIKIQPVKNVAPVTDNAAKINQSGITDAVAENMLLYQRSNGGWPKHFPANKNVDYKKNLPAKKKAIRE